MKDDDITMGATPPSLKGVGGFFDEVDQDVEEFNEWFGRKVLIHVAPEYLEEAMWVKEEWEDVWIEARNSLRNKRKKEGKE